MYKKTQINGVKCFEADSGCYIDFSNKLCCHNVFIQTFNNLNHLYIFGDVVIVLDEVNRAFVLKNNSLIESSFDFRIGTLKFPFVGFYKREQPRKYGVYDYSAQKILFETTDWIGRDIIGCNILAAHQGYIVCRIINCARPKWQFDLGNLGEFVNDLGAKFPYEVEKFIGVVGKSLLVLLKQKEILVFDVDSGIVTQRMKTIDCFLGETTIDAASPDILPFYITKYFVQIERGVIYAFFIDVLYVISREKQSFRTNVIGLKSELEKHGIKPNQVSRNTFYFDDRIYFLEQELGRFVILNVESKTIEYVSEVIEINGEGVGFDKLKEIQATADKVYVLDKTNTLHIFQKE